MCAASGAGTVVARLFRVLRVAAAASVLHVEGTWRDRVHAFQQSALGSEPRAHGRIARISLGVLLWAGEEAGFVRRGLGEWEVWECAVGVRGEEVGG